MKSNKLCLEVKEGGGVDRAWDVIHLVKAIASLNIPRIYGMMSDVDTVVPTYMKISHKMTFTLFYGISYPISTT